VHFLRYLPGWVAVGFALASALLLVWVSGSGGEGSRRAAKRPASEPARFDRPWVRASIVLLMGVGFVLLRSATHLLGDGYLYLRELSLKGLLAELRATNEPGSLRLVSLVHDLCAAVGGSPVTAYRVYSVASGACYVLLAFPVARLVGRTPGARVAALGLLLTPGFLQLFFGYVETYAFVVPATLLYLWLGLRALTAPRLLWFSAALLGVLLILHVAEVALLPSLLMLAWLAPRRAAGAGGGRHRLALALVPLVAVGMLLLLRFDFATYGKAMRANHMLPLAGQPDFWQPYRMLSWAHAVDLFNQGLLVIPAAALLLPAMLHRQAWRSDRAVFLLSATVPLLLFAFLVNPEIGTFRDWDLLALPAIPLSLWLAQAAAEHLDRDPSWRRAVLAACGASALHTLLWVGVNANQQSALARFEHGLQAATLSRHARAYGWESLGSYYEQEVSDPRRAMLAYDRAVAVDGNNPRYWDLTAGQAMALGDFRKAVQYLEKAVSLQATGNPTHLNNLGACYTQLGDHERAIHYFQQAVATQPTFVMGQHNLGLALARVGRFEEAASVLTQASALQPANLVLLRDLAPILAQLGRLAEADSVMRRVQEMAARNAASRGGPTGTPGGRPR
jgi:tetratricopeptide (TPR) repeat protein